MNTEEIRQAANKHVDSLKRVSDLCIKGDVIVLMKSDYDKLHNQIEDLKARVIEAEKEIGFYQSRIRESVRLKNAAYSLFEKAATECNRLQASMERQKEDVGDLLGCLTTRNIKYLDGEVRPGLAVRMNKSREALRCFEDIKRRAAIDHQKKTRRIS